MCYQKIWNIYLYSFSTFEYQFDTFTLISKKKKKEKNVSKIYDNIGKELKDPDSKRHWISYMMGAKVKK